MWIDALAKAMSQTEDNPDIIRDVANLTSDCQNWSKEDWEIYNLVAGAIVEPFSFPGVESDNEELYYEKIACGDLGEIKANLPETGMKEEWLKIISLLEEVGY
jgi:hypothetical protein